MKESEAKRVLIDCRSLLTTLLKFRLTAIIDMQSILDVFEVEKMVDDLEELMKHLNIVFDKGE
jgi:hypothetical protein